MAFCDSPAVGVLENHPNKSDSKAHRASPELGASLGQVTEKKQNKQRGETAHHRGNPQGGWVVGHLGFISSGHCLSHRAGLSQATLSEPACLKLGRQIAGMLRRVPEHPMLLLTLKGAESSQLQKS